MVKSEGASGCWSCLHGDQLALFQASLWMGTSGNWAPATGLLLMGDLDF